MMGAPRAINARVQIHENPGELGGSGAGSQKIIMKLYHPGFKAKPNALRPAGVKLQGVAKQTEWRLMPPADGENNQISSEFQIDLKN